MNLNDLPAGDPVRFDSSVKRLVLSKENPELGLGKARIQRCCGSYSCNRFNVSVRWEQEGNRDSYSDFSFAALMRTFRDLYTVVPTDPWGRRLVEAFDGHDSFGCNNHECEQHPHSLYGKKDTRTGELV